MRTSVADVAAEKLPWLAAPLRRALETQSAHALLLHGPSGVGQFELAMALAQGWLCESSTVPIGARPCSVCAICTRTGWIPVSVSTGCR